jgi:hypothetical protein|tara:strand:- start:299 stop:451 length:153 start_codon:yes stop_codon:yes gene_type:complete
MPKEPNPAINSLSAYCQDISLNRIAKQVTENPKYLSFKIIYINIKEIILF